MMYARIDPNTGAADVRSFDAAPAAAKGWLPYSVDPQPTPSATQAVVNAGVVFDAAAARQTWALRDKTQAELDAEARTAEKDMLLVAAAFLDSAAPTTVAQCAADIQKIKRCLKWLLDQAVRRGVV